MSFWDEIGNIDSLKDIGLDVGAISTDIFGENQFTNTIGSMLEIGGNKQEADRQKEVERQKQLEAEAIEKARRTETKVIEQTFQAKSLGFLEKNQDKIGFYGLIFGVVGFIFLVFRRGK